MSITAGSDGLAADFISTSAGSSDSGRVPKVNAQGVLDSTFFGLSLTAGQAFTAGQAAYMDSDSNCVSLNGSSHYLSSAASTFNLNSDLTLECWVNFTATPTAGNTVALMARINAATVGYRLSLTNVAGTLKLACDIGATEVVVNWTPSTSTWYHVAVVYTKSAGSAAFYVNGAQQGTTQTGLNTSISDPGVSFTIGAALVGAANAAAQFLNASVDAPRVWNTARSSGSISADYNKLLGGSETNLIGYWALNGDLTDRTSNANTLTNNGGAAFLSSTAGITGQYIRIASAALSDTSAAYIGFALTSISALATGAFVTFGPSSIFSGLTSGKQYYLSNTPGAIATSAGTVTRKVGIAITSTMLLNTNIW